MSSGIYLITNLINNHLYIGKSINIEKRFKDHINVSNNPNSPEYKYPIHSAIRKYGSNNFRLSILEEIEPYVDTIANEKEKYWIKKLDTFHNREHYNLTLGGEGIRGKKFSAEDRKKLSQRQKEAYQTPQGKIRAKKHSTYMSGESNPLYGKHANGKKVLCIETQQVYPSARAAAKAANRSHTSIISACLGKQKSAGGLHWKYLE